MNLAAVWMALVCGVLPTIAQACPRCKAGVLAALENIKPTAVQSPNAVPDCCKDGKHDHGSDLAMPPGVASAPGTRGSSFSLAGGVDFSTGYYHRGMNMGDRGLFVQPHLTFGLPTIQTNGWSISPYAGVWNSFQEGLRGHGEYRAVAAVDDSPGVTTVANARGPFPRHFIGDPSHDAAYAQLLEEFFGGRSGTGARYSGWGWYECEISVGTLFVKGPFQFDLKYQAHIFPGGDVNGFQELMFKGAYDINRFLSLPESPLKPVTLNVFAEYGFQLAGSDGRNAYVECGIEPTWVVPAFGTLMGVSLPVTVGLSTDNYYVDSFGSNETFGYVGIAAKASIRVAQSDTFGSVFLNASVQYMRLESDVLVLANAGDKDVLLATVGLSFSR